MKEKLAVCLNVFNAEDIIERVLESFLAQSEKEFYVFLIDNGSTDKTLSICDNFIRVTTFAGITWPDIYIFKAESYKETLFDFLERLCEVMKRVTDSLSINKLYFIQQDRPLEVDEVEKEYIKMRRV